MGLFYTERNWLAFFCRIAIAAVFIPHGLDKLVKYDLLGWNGPEPWALTMSALLKTNFLAEQHKLLLAQIAAWTEVAAGGACLLGLMVRIAVLPLIASRCIALAIMANESNLLNITRFPNIAVPVLEFNVILSLICLGLLASGAGSLSLDKFITGEPEYEYEYDDEYDEDEAPPNR
ncbi:MAG: DoxX family protein [bacterium]|nr:DoxX family protein [Candidatus Sumerlaeota bacterium]